MIGIFGVLLFVLGLRMYWHAVETTSLKLFQKAETMIIAGFLVFWIWLLQGGRS